MSRELADKYPVALVNSVNPYRLEGQKTASFEIVDFLGDAPDVHVLPVGNAGNISAYWKGYIEYAEAGMSTRLPQMLGWQAAGAAPLVQGEPVTRPETVASAIRIGNPASWDLAVDAQRSGGRFGAVTDEEILLAQRQLAACEGVFVEPGSAASVAGLLQDVAAGEDFRRADDGRDRHRARAEGHRHRAVDLHRPRRHRRRGRASRRLPRRQVSPDG